MTAASVNQLVQRIESEKLPLSEKQLCEIRESARAEVSVLMSRTCHHCMDLEEYLQLQMDINARMAEMFADIEKENVTKS